MLKLLTILVLMLLAFGCAPDTPSTEQDPQQLRSEIPATEVRTSLTRKAPFEYLIQSTGKIQSAIDIKIYSHSAGIVKKLLITNAGYAVKGSALAELENEKQALALEKARINLIEKKVNFDDQVMRYDDDSVKFAKARDNIRITSGLAAAEVAYREAKLEFDYTFIRATATGRVTDLEVKAGASLTAGQVFCQLYDPSNMIVVCNVLEADALVLKLGVTSEVQTLGIEPSILTGTVKEINPRVDSKTNLVNVIVQLNATKAMMPGMSVQITLKVRGKETILVPKEAVVIRSGKQVVFTLEDNLAKWNYVKIGSANGKDVAVLEGLKQNQQVIITNNLQLAHDAPVKKVE